MKTSWFPVQFLIGNIWCSEFIEGNFGCPKKSNIFLPKKLIESFIGLLLDGYTRRKLNSDWRRRGGLLFLIVIL